MKKVNGMLMIVVINGRCGFMVLGMSEMRECVIVFIIFVLERMFVKMFVVNIIEIMFNVFFVCDEICFCCFLIFG